MNNSGWAYKSWYEDYHKHT